MTVAASSVAAASVGGVVAWALTPTAAGAAWRWNVLDRPGPLKMQTTPIPYLGGLAVAAGLVAAVALAGRPLLIVPPVAALLLGLVDDVRPLSVAVRLPAELGIGVTVAFAAGLTNQWAIAAAAVFAVAVLNAMNFVDGMDGLAASVTGTAALGCAVLGGLDWAVLAAGLGGACGGFLVYNRPPARIYLGDAGAYLLGTTLALLLVHAATAHGATATGVGALAIGAYPLIELASTVGRRLRSGNSVFVGDRGHVYDRLRDRGWSKRATLTALTLLQGAAVAGGVLVLLRHG